MVIHDRNNYITDYGIYMTLYKNTAVALTIIIIVIATYTSCGRLICILYVSSKIKYNITVVLYNYNYCVSCGQYGGVVWNHSAMPSLM